MFSHFFTTEKTQPPAIGLPWFLLMLLLIGFTLYVTIRYHESLKLQRFFKGLQIFQLICLYAWYISMAIPFSNSLPFYHCRLAMFVLVFLPGKSALKQFFALLGFSGAIFALAYPVFDPYSWPHITGFSFLLGHYALLANASLYLMNHYDKKVLSYFRIIAGVFVLDAFQVLVNLVTGGNYGLMKTAPILGTTFVPLNYLLVSTILATALCLTNGAFAASKKKLFNKA